MRIGHVRDEADPGGEEARVARSAPLIDAANSGAKVPNTVEVLTPTFSNTRPVINPMTPPPPGAPEGSGRSHGVRTKRPAGDGAASARDVLVLDRLESGAELRRGGTAEPRLRGELLVVEGRGVGTNIFMLISAQRLEAGAKKNSGNACGGMAISRSGGPVISASANSLANLCV